MNDSTENQKTKQSAPKKRPKSNRRGLIVIVLFAFAMILFVRQDPVVTINCSDEIIAQKPDIIMLGAWWCGYCQQAKRYFQHNDISYCEYDVENTAEGKRLYQENGSGPVPILLIGEYRLSGFHEQQVQAALKLLRTPD